MEVAFSGTENEQYVWGFEVITIEELSIIESKSSARIDQTKLESERLVETNRIEIEKTIESLAVEKDKHLRIINELANTEKEKAAILKRYNVDLERLKRDEEIIQLEIEKNQKVKLSETAAFRK